MKIDFFHWRGLSAAAVALASLAVSCQDPIETPNPGPGPEPEPGTDGQTEIVLDREVEESGMYFGDFWKEGTSSLLTEKSE